MATKIIDVIGLIVGLAFALIALAYISNFLAFLIV